MRRPATTMILLVGVIASIGLATAQSTTLDELDERLRVLTALENTLLLERDELRQALDDPATAVLYHPNADRWTIIPRDEAERLVDLLNAAWTWTPSVWGSLQQRFDLPVSLLEAIVDAPGGADPATSLAAVEAAQRPQLEAIVTDYDALVGEVQELYAATVAERDALLAAPGPATPPANSDFGDFAGMWQIDGLDEVVRITQTGARIEAVKTVGNDNVPANELNFWVDLSTLDGQGQIASAGFRNARMVSVSMTVLDDDTFEIAWANGYVGTYIRQSP